MGSPETTTSPRGVSILRNAGHGANDLYWFILPPVLPLILQEFGLRYAAAGGIIAVYLSMIAVASMLTGRLSDRMHRGRLIGFGFLLASLAVFAASLMPRLGLVIGLLVVAGIGVSTYHPAAYAAIHDAGQGRGRTYGNFEASGSLAVLTMLALQGLLLARIGWRGMIVVGAIPGAIMGIVLVAAPRLSFGRSTQPRPAAAASARATVTPPAASVLLSAVFVLGVMLRILGFNALQNFAPTYLVRAVHMDPAVAALAMGVSFVGGVTGALTMGRAADRFGPFPVFALCSGLLAPLLSLLSLRLPPLAYPGLLFLVGFCSSACYPTQTMILGGLSGSRGKGTVFGVLMGATALTAAASPLLFGLVADQSGLVNAVRVCGIPVAAGWVVTFAVWRKLSSSARPRPQGISPVN
jgi:MFS family permease